MSSGISTSISPEGICNMALGHLKISKQIAVLATDKSAEAIACRMFYDICRQTLNADFKWPFATTQAALALVEENPFPTDSSGNSEWAYGYQYPSDCMNAIRIISGIRNETRAERIPFRIVNGPNGKMILCDVEQAILEYTQEMMAEDSMTASYVLAFSLKLAVLISPMVTGGDPFKLSDRAQKMYLEAVTRAQANALNEEQTEEDPLPEFIQARN